MAQTHENITHGFLERLIERTKQQKVASTIAAGKPGEIPICQWKASNGIHCTRLPDDEQGILRISIGGGEHLPVTMNYASVRGSIGQVIELLEKTLVALRECPE